VELQLHAFLNSALDGGEWLDSRLRRFTPGERAPGIHLIGDWVDPKAGLDAVEKRIPAPTGSQTLAIQPVTKSLYWLSYIGSSFSCRADAMCVDIYHHFPVFSHKEWLQMMWAILTNKFM